MPKISDLTQGLSPAIDKNDKVVFVDVDDTTMAPSGTTKFSTVGDMSSAVGTQLQGHYALLTSFYFGGSATDSRIETADIGVWKDVEFTPFFAEVGSGGVFDYRPEDMSSAQASGHTGTGSAGDPIVFLLEGLSLKSSCSLRAVMDFNPDEDEGRLDSRLLFNRHTGANPSTDFGIEASSIAMESGANIEYANSPNIQFFIGDTVDTNGSGDAGKVRFQIRSDVAGTISIKEIALFIQA
tara:strand:+ start:11062 stop:11778 length:717 start_codon:yes stop_codon:yes gene_type:complete